MREPEALLAGAFPIKPHPFRPSCDCSACSLAQCEEIGPAARAERDPTNLNVSGDAQPVLESIPARWEAARGGGRGQLPALRQTCEALARTLSFTCVNAGMLSSERAGC